MSKAALVICACMYFIAAAGEGIRWELRLIFCAYAGSNLLLARIA